MLNYRRQGLRGFLEGQIAAHIDLQHSHGRDSHVGKRRVVQRKGSFAALQPRRLKVCSCPHGRVAKLKDFSCCGAHQCRLPGAEGTWMVVRGGMGTVTSQLAQASYETLPARPRPAAACGTVRSSRLGVCAGAKSVASLSLHSPCVGAGCKGVQTVSMPCRL